jgi:hypothetical protein
MAAIDDALFILTDPKIAAIGKLSDSRGRLRDVSWAIKTVVQQITRPVPPTPSGRVGKLEFDDPVNSEHL